jgi:hypothetical protein
MHSVLLCQPYQAEQADSITWQLGAVLQADRERAATGLVAAVVDAGVLQCIPLPGAAGSVAGPWPGLEVSGEVEGKEKKDFLVQHIEQLTCLLARQPVALGSDCVLWHQVHVYMRGGLRCLLKQQTRQPEVQLRR